MNESDIVLFVTVDGVFPEVTATEAALQEALAGLSRDETLIVCAHLSAIVAGFGPELSLHERQKRAIALLRLPQQHTRALGRYALMHGGPEKVCVFFRGQLLELARYVVKHCPNHPEDGRTFDDPDVRATFLRAALIASTLWERRVYGPQGIQPNADPDAQLRQVLGAFRKSVEESSPAPEPFLLIARGWVMFSRYLPARLPQFAEAFERATGISLRQHFVCAAAVMQRSFAEQPDRGRMFLTDYVQGDTPFKEIFRTFMRVHSQSPEEWAQSLEATPNDSGYRSLRERPLLRFAAERSIIFDPAFFLDSLVSSPLFRVKDAGISMRTAFTAFGYAFEDYARALLRERFPSSPVLADRLRCNVQGENALREAFEVDAVLNELTTAVVFEMKAVWIREETILGPDPEVFLTELRAKYGYVPEADERGKGVAQLARSIGALARREWRGLHQEYAQVAAVFPVLTVFDTRMAAPGSGRFLETEFRALLGPVPEGFTVYPLIIMTVSDLEHLIASLESRSLVDFLHAYSKDDPERKSSVHNFMAHSDFSNEVRRSPRLLEVTQELLEAARAELWPDGGPPSAANADPATPGQPQGTHHAPQS